MNKYARFIDTINNLLLYKVLISICIYVKTTIGICLREEYTGIPVLC
jgi:hypothetical protein